MFSAGCQTVLPPKNEPVALMEHQQPMVIDEATQRRDFEKSTFYYPSQATEAGSPRFPFAARSGASRIERAAVEPALFLANVAVLPFTYLVKPPGTAYDWHATVTEPSYTVQPAYPVEAPATGGTRGDGAAAGGGGGGGGADDVGLVPDPQSPVPNPSEPVRDPTGAQPNLPTENQGPNETPGAPADSTPQPTAPPGDASGGGTGGATGGGAGGAP